MGYKESVTIAGIPLFFILFFITFLIWILDFNRIKKYYNNILLLYFILFGLFYVLISYIGGFSLIFEIPVDKKYIFRQAYFLPFLTIAVPVFIRSFQFGLFKYLIKNKFTFIISAYFIFPASTLFSTIIIYSINKKFIAFGIFIITLLLDGGFHSSLQIILMQVILLSYFIFNLKLNYKFITLSILVLIFSAYYISDEIILLLQALNANAGWRLFIWVDNIKSTVNDTFLIGHGFGTTYFFSPERNPGDFIRLYPMGNTLRTYLDPYVVEHVLGQHNSFINIFYRLGIIGLLLFISFFNLIAKKIKNIRAPQQLNYVILFCMIIIGANVGLESPGYATQFVFLLGLVFHLINEHCKKLIIS